MPRDRKNVDMEDEEDEEIQQNHSKHSNGVSKKHREDSEGKKSKDRKKSKHDHHSSSSSEEEESVKREKKKKSKKKKMDEEENSSDGGGGDEDDEDGNYNHHKSKDKKKKKKNHSDDEQEEENDEEMPDAQEILEPEVEEEEEDDEDDEQEQEARRFQAKLTASEVISACEEIEEFLSIESLSEPVFSSLELPDKSVFQKYPALYDVLSKHSERCLQMMFQLIQQLSSRSINAEDALGRMLENNNNDGSSVPSLYLELGLWKRISQLNKQIQSKCELLEKEIKGDHDAELGDHSNSNSNQQQQQQQQSHQHITKSFKDWYKEEFTTAFADDIETLRQDGHFDAKSVAVLISCIESGMAIVPNVEQRLLVNSMHLPTTAATTATTTTASSSSASASKRK